MAGRIPQSFINDLLARVDIVDVIERRVPLRKAGKDYKARCPFHEEKTPSFTVSQQKQLYHCFGCGASGGALGVLMEYDQLEFVPAVEALAALAGVEVPREAGGPPKRSDEGLYAVMERANRYFRTTLKSSRTAIDYLKGRGVNGVTAQTFGIGFAPDGWNNIATALPDVAEATLLELGLLTRNDSGRVYDKFRARVMFPIRDTRGRVVGFGGRVLGGDDGPKYLNSPETPIFHKGQELYGLYEARRSVRKLDRLIVVEGYLDVVSMAQAGISTCVAALGTAISTEQMRKLFRYVDDVVCCFDGDRAGRQAAWRALEASLPVLSEGKRARFVFLPEGEDPDSLVRKIGKDAFLARLDGAIPAVEYLFSTLSQGLNLDSLDDRARLVSLARPHIEKVQEGVLRDLMLQHLQRLSGSRLPRAMPVQTAERPRRAPGPPQAAGRLRERLHLITLRYPEVVAPLIEAVGDFPASGDADPMPVFLAYLAQQPGAVMDELLALWVGEPGYEELLELTARQLPVEDPLKLGEEFLEIVQRLRDMAARSRRSELLSRVREEPSQENLRQLLAERRSAPDT
ncbi:MAG: DNA primase [Pseudomonadales bacterium]